MAKKPMRAHLVYFHITSFQAYNTYKLGGKMSELLYSPATYGVDFNSKTFLRPRARQAPMMAVVKNTLWLLGGIVEVRLILPVCKAAALFL